MIQITLYRLKLGHGISGTQQKTSARDEYKVQCRFG